MCTFFFFFNDTATTEIYTLSLHDALPIYPSTGNGRVFVHSASDQYTVTWCNVRGFESQRIATIQVSLLPDGAIDRKSTRLNSSHANISYAVFCLKKKNNEGVSYS